MGVCYRAGTAAAEEVGDINAASETQSLIMGDCNHEPTVWVNLTSQAEENNFLTWYKMHFLHELASSQHNYTIVATLLCNNTNYVLCVCWGYVGVAVALVPSVLKTWE